MVRRLIRFGLPGGLRFSTEVAAWTVFLVFVGRIGTLELASTTIAWRINGAAFFPIIGLSEAIRTLVGQAQGRHEPAESVRITVQGLLIAEAWMLATAALFVVIPRPLYALFETAGGEGPAAFATVADIGVVLLRFVAVYCLLDGFNAAGRDAEPASDTPGDGCHCQPMSSSAAHLSSPTVCGWGTHRMTMQCSCLPWPSRLVVALLAGGWRHIRVIDR